MITSLKIHYKKLKSPAGFTLLELILYISLLAAMLMVFSIFLGVLFRGRIKNQTITEVHQQAMQVMQLMTQTIRNAEGINFPPLGTEAQSLSLNVLDAAKDPTIFDVSGDIIHVTEGVGSAIPLTSSRVIASDFSFKNLSRNDISGIIQIQFTLTHVNPGGRNEYDYTKVFYGSESLRPQ